MATIDKSIFLRNLEATRYYCQAQLTTRKAEPVAAMLRSFNPFYKTKQLFTYHPNEYVDDPQKNLYPHWNFDPYDHNNGDIIEDLFAKQEQFKLAFMTGQEKADMPGEIFVASIDETVLDGASGVTSNGLIDDYDMPPIDSWIYIYNKNGSRLLFAWIPQPLIGLAQNAIDVNCVACISWFKDSMAKDYQRIMSGC